MTGKTFFKELAFSEWCEKCQWVVRIAKRRIV